jgi:Spy/CpxP family protein refolding chaperone
MRNNNKILTIAVVLLLVANIALVAFMLMGKKKGKDKHSARKDPAAMMIEELNMTEQQQTEYKQLKEEHFKNVKPLFDSVRAAKTAFFALSKEANVSDSLIDVYSNRVADKRAELDKATLAHFRRIRNLFTAEQQPKFDSFMQKMMQRERGKRDSAGKDK